jgi:hypothetical protein
MALNAGWEGERNPLTLSVFGGFLVLFDDFFHRLSEQRRRRIDRAVPLLT